MASNPPQTRIFRQFLLFVLPFVILGIATVSAVLMWTDYRYFQKTIDQDYRNILRASASEIDLFMDNAVHDMETLAWVLRAARLDDWRTEMVLSAFQFKKPKFEQVVLIATDGRHLPAAGGNPFEEQPSAAGVVEKAFSGEAATSAVVDGDDHLPMVHMAVPVQRLGKIEAAIYARLNLKHVWDVLEGIRIGETGQVFIIDPSGRYLAHREIDRVVGGMTLSAAEMVPSIKNSPFPVQWVETADGKRYLCLGTHLPDRDWIIVLRQSMPEIYAYLFLNFFWAAVVIALACPVVIALGWFQVNKLTRPIERMHRQVRRIGRGDLDHPVSVTATNEIGALGEAFNEMSASLKATIDREIRTAAELAHARNLADLGVSASKVTHEVGNLLNNVGMSATTLKGENLSPRGAETLARMEAEAARTKTFLQDFLKFAKLPALQPAPVALDLVIREVLAMHGPAFRERGIEFVLAWPPDVPLITGDARLLYQAFNNLVKNSIEAVDGNGQVRVSAAIDGEWIEICVADNGVGIAPEDRERIFEPFFTTKGKAGNGLGMAIVRSIVTAHRGGIACISEMGKGTRMVVRLPLT